MLHGIIENIGERPSLNVRRSDMCQDHTKAVHTAIRRQNILRALLTRYGQPSRVTEPETPSFLKTYSSTR